MSKPLYDALCSLARENPLRMHMPGHKGVGTDLFSEIYSIDFTEIPPTGNLYTGEGPISQAEDLCAKFAGAKAALFFTCGSTQGIYTMLAEAVGIGGELILERNCHKSVYNAMALLDITPHYIFSKVLPDMPLPGPVSAELVAAALEQWPQSKAVFLTSPTYYGIMTDIKPISDLCHRKNCYLLVDQAHGAHFPVLGIPSAAQEGADLSVVSTHKTWPAMGSSSILYLGSNAFDQLHLKKTSSIFGTTSPSYPILASIDYARERLSGDMGEAYRKSAEMTQRLRAYINGHTPFRALTPTADIKLDPCRLTIDTRSGGINGYTADQMLQSQNIYVEMSDENYLVMILSCQDGEETFLRLKRAIDFLSESAKQLNSDSIFDSIPKPIIRSSIRNALFGLKKEQPLVHSVGCIAACIVAPYPPGIPILAPGEEITEKHIAYLQKKRYNINENIAVISTAD